jgi:hypothetical protein
LEICLNGLQFENGVSLMLKPFKVSVSFIFKILVSIQVIFPIESELIVFAFVVFGHGIAAFVLSLIPVACFYSFLFVIPGFIFSGLGRNSNKENFAKKGKLFSTLGLIFGIIMTILTIVLFVLLIEYADATYETIYDEWYF